MSLLTLPDAGWEWASLETGEEAMVGVRIRELTLGIMAATLLAAAPAVAFAGSNGQIEDPGTNLGATRICIDGTNQNGNHAYNCWNVRAYYFTPINGWWWEYWAENSFNDGNINWQYVPQSQSSNYWCFYENSSGWAC